MYCLGSPDAMAQVQSVYSSPTYFVVFFHSTLGIEFKPELVTVQFSLILHTILKVNTPFMIALVFPFTSGFS